MSLVQGADGFNNLLDDCAGPGAAAGLRVDLAAHAASLGALVEVVAPDGSAGWEVGVGSGLSGRPSYEREKARQLRWLVT